MTDTEKKIRLTRFLREENMRNQIRVKNREEILYGSGKPWMPDDEIVSSYETYALDQSGQMHQNTSFRFDFRIRAVIALFLFAALLYMDLTEKTIINKSAREWVTEQLNWSTEAKLIDFMESFPYTLSDESGTE